MRLLKIQVGMLLIIGMLMTTFFNVKASEEIDDVILTVEQKKGIDNFDDDIKKEIYDTLKKDPTNVSIGYDVSEIDEVEAIKKIANSTVKELQMKDQYTKEEAIAVKAEVDKLEKLSQSELKKNYNFSNVEAKIYFHALHNNEKEQSSTDQKNEVSTSGSISSAKMASSIAVTDHSKKNSKGKRTNSNYRLNTTFTWKSEPKITMFSDKVALAWGGNYNISYVSHKATYRWYSPLKAKWMTEVQNMSHTEKPNKNATYTFKQRAANSKPIYKASVSADLKQSGYKGKSTKITSRYGHKVVKVTPSISFPIGIGISFGTGFDQSAQLSKNVKY